VSLPVLDQLVLVLVHFEVSLELKVLLQSHVAAIHDQVRKGHFSLLSPKLLQTGWLLETELLGQDLNRHDVEQAALDIEAHEQIKHLISHIKATSGIFVGCCSLSLSWWGSLRALSVSVFLPLISFFLVLFPIELDKFDQTVKFIADFSHLGFTFLATLRNGLLEFVLSLLELLRHEDVLADVLLTQVLLDLKLSYSCLDALLHLNHQGVCVEKWSFFTRLIIDRHLFLR